MSAPSNFYQTTYPKTTETRFVNVENRNTLHVSPNRNIESIRKTNISPNRFTESSHYVKISPNRYGESSNLKYYHTQSSHQIATPQPEYKTLTAKSIGTFGNLDMKTSVQVAHLESNHNLNQHVADLNSQIRRLTEKSDQLFNENRVLKKDSESLVICRGRLEEKENEVKKYISNNGFLEVNIKNLKAEIERSYEQNRQLSNQLSDIFNKNPGRFHMDQVTRKILSAEEYEMERKIQSLEEKVLNLEKERDKLFIENYEFKKLHGEEIEIETPGDMFGSRYHNGLQIASLDLNKSKKKIDSLQNENNLLRNELNILRGIDCFEEDEVKSTFKRNNAQTKQRNQSNEARQ